MLGEAFGIIIDEMMGALRVTHTARCRYRGDLKIDRVIQRRDAAGQEMSASGLGAGKRYSPSAFVTGCWRERW